MLNTYLLRLFNLASSMAGQHNFVATHPPNLFLTVFFLCQYDQLFFAFIQEYSFHNTTILILCMTLQELICSGSI